MNNANIVGGVSPLKKKAGQASRGGKDAGKATKTVKKRGGFAKSKGARGAGGANLGGYNVQTSFKPGAAWNKPGSGGTTTTPNPKKPYSYTPDGELVVNDPFATKKWTDPTKGSTEETLKKSKSGVEIGSWDYEKDGSPTYKQAYELNLENVRDKFKTEQDYVDHMEKIKAGDIKGASKEDIHKSIYETKTVTKKGKPGFWTYYDEDGGEISKEEYSKYKK